MGSSNQGDERSSCRLAAIQMVSGADPDVNRERAAFLLDMAAANGAEMAVLPENFAVLDGGPQAEVAEVEGDLTAPLQGMLSQKAKSLNMIIVAGTIPLISRPGDPDSRLTDGRVRPASLMFGTDGQIKARYDKMHLFDVEVSDRQARYAESDSFEAGDHPVAVDTPLGKVGMTICYDVRFPELYRYLFEQQVSFITVPAAFTRVTGEAHWEILLRARAIENQCFVIGAGQGGVHNERRETYGHSMIIDPWGRVLASQAQGEGVVVADANLAMLKEIRSKMPVRDHRRLKSL